MRANNGEEAQLQLYPVEQKFLCPYKERVRERWEEKVSAHDRKLLKKRRKSNVRTDEGVTLMNKTYF